MRGTLAMRRRIALGVSALVVGAGAAGLVPPIAAAQPTQCASQEALLQVYQQNLANAPGAQKAYWENQIYKLETQMEQEGCL